MYLRIDTNNMVINNKWYDYISYIMLKDQRKQADSMAGDIKFSNAYFMLLQLK